MTDTPVQALDLDVIKARAQAATTGPWEVMVVGNCAEVTGLHRPWRPVWAGRSVKDHFRTFMIQADAEFIAHARTDIPALVAEVEQLRAIIFRQCLSMLHSDTGKDATMTDQEKTCALCGHPQSWHRHDDINCLGQHHLCDPSTAIYRCVGYDCVQPGYLPGPPETRCGCSDFVESRKP